MYAIERLLPAEGNRPIRISYLIVDPIRLTYTFTPERNEAQGFKQKKVALQCIQDNPQLPKTQNNLLYSYEVVKLDRTTEIVQ